ncbi:MAG: ribosome small subunit-dependent GTPase A [Cellvibrio sp.]
MINLDFESLRPIGLTPYISQRLLMQESENPASFAARIIEIHRDRLVLHNGKNELTARSIAHSEHNTFAVGDWVIAEPCDNKEFRICSRIEPVTEITRRTQNGSCQHLVSNVDTALLVMGLDNDFNLRRMERYLTIVQAAHVTPVIVLTKRDLVSDADEKLEQVRQRLPVHITSYALNSHEQEAAITLAPWLNPGQTLVLLGSSGAGKSTLTNRLTSSQQQTGHVRASDGRGRHTTTSRSLHVSEQGACIIDTPGLRAWSPDIDEDSLDLAFDDIASLARNCKFRNCQHKDEPGCAVRGIIDDDRLKNYQKLLREIKRGQQTALERIEERAKWKLLHKAGEARTREKRQGH